MKHARIISQGTAAERNLAERARRRGITDMQRVLMQRVPLQKTTPCANILGLPIWERREYNSSLDSPISLPSSSSSDSGLIISDEIPKKGEGKSFGGLRAFRFGFRKNELQDGIADEKRRQIRKSKFAAAMKSDEKENMANREAGERGRRE